MEGSHLKESYDIRLEELEIMDLAFLHGCQRPTLAVLHQVRPGLRIPLM